MIIVGNSLELSLPTFTLHQCPLWALEGQADYKQKKLY